MANYSGTGIDLPFSASGDLNSYQYCFVKAASAPNRIELSTGGSDPIPIGVLQNDPYSTDAAKVRIAGITKLYVSSSVAIQVGNLLISGSVGNAEIVNSDASAFGAIALEDVAAGTSYISALLRPNVSALAGTK